MRAAICNDQAHYVVGAVETQLEASRRPSRWSSWRSRFAPGSTRHPRTIRRDLAALEETGYPHLVTERINGRLLAADGGFTNIPGLRFAVGINGAHVQPDASFLPPEGTGTYLAQSALGKAAAACCRRAWRW